MNLVFRKFAYIILLYSSASIAQPTTSSGQRCLSPIVAMSLVEAKQNFQEHRENIELFGAELIFLESTKVAIDDPYPNSVAIALGDVIGLTIQLCHCNEALGKSAECVDFLALVKEEFKF